MNVAIVSELSFQKQIETFFNTFEKNHNIKFKKFFFNNDKGFMSQQKNFNFDLIFLFHSNKNPFLFNLAAKIKEFEPNCEVIFASSNAEFAISGYKIGLNFYLIHPFSNDEFDFAINKSLKNSKKQSNHILINSGWQKVPIELSKIHFIEKIGHNVVIHTTEKIFSTRTTLTNFIDNFKNMPNFVHCVRGAIVNLVWVQAIESQNFLMKTGERISIRRKDRRKMKQIYSEFLIYNKMDQQN